MNNTNNLSVIVGTLTLLCDSTQRVLDSANYYFFCLVLETLGDVLLRVKGL